PLSSRSEDISVLALHFMKHFAKKNERDIKGFTPEAMDAMIRYHWPGNVRELMNSMERAVVLARSDYLSLEDFPLIARKEDGSTARYNGKDRGRSSDNRDNFCAILENSTEKVGITVDLPLAHVEREAVLGTLESAGGNRSEAARRLGITRKTLLKKLKSYGKA
ncbi:MAG: two-component system response regulator, partial [Desulfamplus sp.]|nr:two-component system response regulator [Desulfamplus sp.]